MTDIAGNITTVRARIEASCARAGRDVATVTLVGISKGHSPAAIAEAYAAGLRDIGENRVQEASAKIAALAAEGVAPRWHLVGNLQTNKVRSAIGLFDILHGIDSERLAEVISRNAERTVAALLEVNVAGEATKHGFAPADVPGAVERIGRLPGIELLGLMTVAPAVDTPEDVRPVFRRLRELRDAAGLQELSMGMTDDFEVAIEEGATMVRVGRAIFGERAVQQRKA
jgi:PLP dependent protein